MATAQLPHLPPVITLLPVALPSILPSMLRILLLLLLTACSSPTDFWHFNPQRLVIMKAQGPPRDSTTFYFPAADSLHAAYIPRRNRPKEGTSYIATTSCQSHLEYASYTLFRFRAPVLLSAYPGVDTYRFLWMRSFDRPVLLTLQRQQGGTVLRTQFLSKPISAYRPLSAYYLNEELSPTEQAELRKYEQEQMANPERRAALIRAKETVVIRAKETVVIVEEEETTQYVT